MKKISLLLLGLLIFTSCLNHDDAPNFTYKFLTIDDATTPESFTFGETDTISVRYSLPSDCYSFDQIYYETQDTARIVAVSALVILDTDCTEEVVQEEKKFVVTASQTEDYVFKFFKGKDSEGENIFEEVIVPVN